MDLTIFGRHFEIRRKAVVGLRPLSPGSASWWPIIRESFTGAWQQNVEVTVGSALANAAVYSCITLIAADIAKLTLRLVERDVDGIWNETTNPAYSPVLRKPNRYQSITKFVEQWIVSKLSRGNTYVLKQRDNNNLVRALYVLDPQRVTPLVTASGDVYYEIKRDDLSGLEQETITVPASAIIHDLYCPLYHPLVGVSPIFAAGVAALQGLGIQNNSLKFFTNGSHPSGFLTAPGAISDETAIRLKTYWEANFSGENVGKVAVGGDGLKYEPFTMSAVDSQLIEQLKWSAETVCSCFHVPPYMIGIGNPPPYANIEPVLQQYYSQCLQGLLTTLEKCLDEGLGVLEPVQGHQYGTEFDLTDLILMDVATRTKAASELIGSGGVSPDEARRLYLNLGKTTGGNTPYMQQQYWPLAQLATRTIPDPGAAAVAPPPVEEEEDEELEDDEEEIDNPDEDEDEDEDVNNFARAAAFGDALRRKVAENLRAA